MNNNQTIERLKINEARRYGIIASATYPRQWHRENDC